MSVLEAVRWSPDGTGVRIIDQRRLPDAFVERDLRSLADVVDAIRTLAVRGAPAIGIAGAMGLVASLRPFAAASAPAFSDRLAEHARCIRDARPTAVNLPWAIDRMLRRAVQGGGAGSAPEVLARLAAEADAILREDRTMCRQIGEAALPLIPDGARVLTHCNAGALATGGIGTALAPLYLAAAAGRRLEVLVDETRPLYQGSRLTAWELTRAGIRVTVIADAMAASLMRAKRVDLCIVGADRIAANGDVVNKIGTYALAVAAHHHAVPFYVAAPASTLDVSLATGASVPIEERDDDELRRSAGTLLVPPSAEVFNPAFDVTPGALVTAIVTNAGLHRPPYQFGA